MNSMLYYEHYVHNCMLTPSFVNVQFLGLCRNVRPFTTFITKCTFQDKRRFFIRVIRVNLRPKNPMSNRKPDRRVLRTRKQLSDALLTLILEKGYDAVTIEEITERANLGRTTFYLHYKDKDELLYKSLEAVFDDLVAQIEPYPVEEWSMTGERLSGLAFYHAAENAHLYKIILSGQGGTSIAQRIREYIAQTAIRIIKTHYADHITQAPVPIEVLGNYIASSMMGLITWWLENDQPFSAEEMHAFFKQLNFQGVAQTMGLSLPDNLLE